MPTFEEKLFGNRTKSKWYTRFAGAVPNFDADIREILEDPDLPRYPEEPEATFGRAIYFHVQGYMLQWKLSTEYLLWHSGIGKKADLFHEADGTLFAWINGRPIFVTLDAFDLHHETFKALRDYWIDVSNGDYTWRKLQNDLFRLKRIFSEKRNHLKASGLSDSATMNEIDWWLLSPEFKEMWESGYVVKVPRYFIQRPTYRTENQVIIVPSMTKNHSERRFLAKMLAQYISEEARKSPSPI